MKSLEIVNEKIEETKYPTGSLERPVWDDETIINKTELQQIKKDLVLLEVLKEQAKHSKFYSESAIQEINRKFDKMEEEGN